MMFFAAASLLEKQVTWPLLCELWRPACAPYTKQHGPLTSAARLHLVPKLQETQESGVGSQEFTSHQRISLRAGRCRKRVPSFLCHQRTKAWDSRMFKISSRAQVNWRGWTRKQKGVGQGAWYFCSERKAVTFHPLQPHSFPPFHSPDLFSPN